MKFQIYKTLRDKKREQFGFEENIVSIYEEPITGDTYVSQYLKRIDGSVMNFDARIYSGAPLRDILQNFQNLQWEIITDKYVDEQGFPHPNTSSTSKDPHKCTCNLRTIMAQGCICGGI